MRSSFASFVPLSLPPARRVVRSAEFKATYQSGTRISSRFFLAFCAHAAEEAELSRFGFTCPRALGKANVRNRIKRRMREAVRSASVRFPEGWIVVFNPRRSVLDAPFADLCQEIQRVLTKCSA